MCMYVQSLRYFFHPLNYKILKTLYSHHPIKSSIQSLSLSIHSFRLGRSSYPAIVPLWVGRIIDRNGVIKGDDWRACRSSVTSILPSVYLLTQMCLTDAARYEIRRTTFVYLDVRVQRLYSDETHSFVVSTI